jgi:hypothetical protein
VAQREGSPAGNLKTYRTLNGFPFTSTTLPQSSAFNSPQSQRKNKPSGIGWTVAGIVRPEKVTIPP